MSVAGTSAKEGMEMKHGLYVNHTLLFLRPFVNVGTIVKIYLLEIEVDKATRDSLVSE